MIKPYYLLLLVVTVVFIFPVVSSQPITELIFPPTCLITGIIQDVEFVDEFGGYIMLHIDIEEIHQLSEGRSGRRNFFQCSKDYFDPSVNFGLEKEKVKEGDIFEVGQRISIIVGGPFGDDRVIQSYALGRFDECEPGQRMDDKFCSSYKIWVEQKENRAGCENNFECKGNLCTSDGCSDRNFFKRLLNWLKGAYDYFFPDIRP